MKKLVVLLTLVAAASAFSQGQVQFNNKVSAFNVDAPITYDGTGPKAAGKIDGAGAAVMDGTLNFGGVNARAALYGGPAGSSADQLSILTPSVPFRSGSAAGYINAAADGGNSTRTVQGIAGGSPAVFQVRAWDTGAAGTGTTSYEDARATMTAAGKGYYGVSGLVNVPQLSSAPATPPALVGLTAFSITWVPEPSIIGLGLLGAVAGMVVFRRRH